MNILLATVGSAGDVHPFVGLGTTLAERGHRVTLLTNGYFEDLARRAGLEFHDPAPQIDFLQMLNDPRLWHRLRGFSFVVRQAVLPVLEPMYQAICERYVPGETVVVASTLALGARIAQEKLGVPLVTVHLSPSIFRSLDDSPRLPGLMLGPGVPRWAKRLQYWLADALMADRLLCPSVNRLRGRLGLAPVRRLMADWWHSPERVLGLFPSWFAPPQPDWPRQLRLTGFPLYDERTVTPPTDAVREFVDRGSPPLVFTPGSANVHGQTFFAAAIEACRRLGRRGLLLTRFPEQLPTELPAEVRHFDYVPLSWLLPRAAAIVHHGGIGTTSQGLAAGVPQLIMPMSFDQMDNAQRLERLGVGDALAPRQFRGPELARRLGMLLDSPVVSRAARDVAGRFQGVDALADACVQIEQVADASAERSLARR